MYLCPNICIGLKIVILLENLSDCAYIKLTYKILLILLLLILLKLS